MAKPRKPKGSYPHVKLEPDVKRLAELVAVHQDKGLAELCNGILKDALNQAWERIREDLANPKRKGGSQTS